MKSILSSLLAFLLASPLASAAEQLVYFGTYTRDGSEGIYVSKFNTATGELGEPTLAAKIDNPSFLSIHPNQRYLFAVSEVEKFGDRRSGKVSSFRIDKATGKLSLINEVASGGTGPCHLSTDSKGRSLLVANYGGGSTGCLTISPTGQLAETGFIQHEGRSVNERRQDRPHAHSANPGPNDEYAFVADLGIDQVLIFQFFPDEGLILEHGSGKVEPGSGPRHFAFHPDGKKAYVINELNLTVTGFNFDPDEGTLVEFQTVSTIPEADRANLQGLSTAEIQVHPSGKFVYGSNRGHDTIAVFKIDESSGNLTLVENENIQGETPRNFGIDPTGKFLLAAGQKSNTVAVFRIDQDSGELEFTGNKIEVAVPVCVKFVEP